MTTDEVECIEEGGTEPTISLLRRLAAALDADVRLTPGYDLGSVGSRPTPACAGADQGVLRVPIGKVSHISGRLPWPYRGGSA
jgi:hypothetical protein